MIVIAPINKTSEVSLLVKNGATEFYAGIIERRSPWFMNARPMKYYNFHDFGSFKEAVKEAEIHQIPFSLCLNASYGKHASRYLLDLIERSMKINVASFIVNDLGLILAARENFKEAKFILSTLAGCFNSETIDFYDNLGVSAVTLDRQLSLEEISNISKKTKIKLIVMIFNITCEYINAFCLMHKFNKVNATNYNNILSRIVKVSTPECKSEYKASVYNRGLSEELIKKFSLSRCNLSCGACAIPVLKEAAVYGVKIIGRQFATDKKIRAVNFISNVIKLSTNSEQSTNGYRTRIRDVYKTIYKKECGSEQCHFPEHLLKTYA